MTTAVTQAAPSDVHHHVAEPRQPGGRTTIEDRAIERMAVHIVAGEPGVGGAARRVWGVAVGPETAEQKPTVEVTATGDVVSLLVRLSVTYPAPVRAVADRVRQHLRDRVTSLTGKTVGQVDIVVVALHRHAVTTRRVR